MTNATVKREVKAVGLVATRTECDEWRVNYRGGSEATAYYTDDADDAVATARAMSHAQSETTAACVRSRS